MPPPQQQQSGQGGDNSLAPLWIVAGIFLGAWIIWTFAHTQIAYGIVQLRIAEADFLQLFTDSVQPLLAKLRSIPDTGYANLSPKSLIIISSLVGDYFKYPVLIVLFILGILSYFRNPQVKFRHSYNMESLLKIDVIDWPQTTPVVSLDLIGTKLDEGSWAAAQTPLYFGRIHNLIQEVKHESTEPTLKHRTRYSIEVLPEKAYRVFSMQLGRIWTTPENLNVHTKALFAIFAARANGKLDEARNLLIQISKSSASGKLNFTGVEAMLQKYKDHKKVQQIINTHAYVLTVMASMLELAREDGVLSSADFLWLKPVDRRLWYLLNSVGRQTPFVEVAGPFAHWISEVELGEKIIVPMVAEAVRGLELAIKEIAYNPDKNG